MVQAELVRKLPFWSKTLCNCYGEANNLLNIIRGVPWSSVVPHIYQWSPSLLKTVLLSVVYYFRAHRLVLHPAKTVFMLFSSESTVKLNKRICIDNKNFFVHLITVANWPIFRPQNSKPAQQKWLQPRKFSGLESSLISKMRPNSIVK